MYSGEEAVRGSVVALHETKPLVDRWAVSMYDHVAQGGEEDSGP